jgi:hypothetical protein
VYDGRDRRNKKQKILILKNKLKWLIEPIEPILVRTYFVVYDRRDRRNKKKENKYLIAPIEPITVRTYIVVYDGRDRRNKG